MMSRHGGANRILSLMTEVTRTRFHGKESSPVEAICELGLERLEAVCSLWIVELPQDVPSSIAG